MTGYKTLDFDTWPRKEHYLYYTQKLKVGCSMTVNLDVTRLVQSCRKRSLRFYPSFVYCTACTVNSMDSMRMFRDKDGRLCIWDHVLPNYTIFHKDDCTFSDVWTDFSPDFETFYSNMIEDMDKYKNTKGIKVKENQPANFFCISCEPWVSFTAFNTWTYDSEPQFFPVITYGKYFEENGRLKMPFNIVIAHAVCDAYHISKLIEELQIKIDKF